MPLETVAKDAGKKAKQTAISDNIDILMGEFKKSGKIGKIKPRDAVHARQIAVAISESMVRRG